MCRPLKSVNVRKFTTVRETMTAIDKELKDLQAIAAETDFSDAEHTDQFSKNITYLKTYFEHCERLTRG